jgi:hypothetical protein
MLRYIPNTQAAAGGGGFHARVHVLRPNRRQGLMRYVDETFPTRGRAIRAARKLAATLKAENWTY